MFAQITIRNFHQDQDGHWVAELSCGHNQHMRHDPPWQLRDWVLTREGRQARIGRPIDCPQCTKALHSKRSV